MLPDNGVSVVVDVAGDNDRNLLTEAIMCRDLELYDLEGVKLSDFSLDQCFSNIFNQDSQFTFYL